MTIKLDVGCGLNIRKPVDEWIHLDGDEGPHIELVCDFGDIPLDDDYVDEIWVGDVIEHIPVWRQPEVLAEWCRILKPGALLNGTTPNLDWFTRQYVSGEITLEWFIQNMYGDRAGPPHQHYITFTKLTLKNLLESNGFADVDYSKSPGGSNPWWLVFSCLRNQL